MATNRTNHITPLMATHPVDILKSEIEARGMTQKELASRLGMKTPNVSRMFRERTTITPAMASKLEEALGIKASNWLNMQANFFTDSKAIAERDKREQAALKIEQMLSSLLNVRELYAKLGIHPCLFIQDKLKKLQERLGAEPMQILEFVNMQRGEHKLSDKLTTDEKNMNTWVILAYISARENIPVGKFEQGDARKAADEIAQTVHSGNASEAVIKSILNKYGISYSVVKKLDKTAIDGYSSWVNGYPAIVTTHRRNDMSCLVFNILHELGHIELHLKEGDGVCFVTEDGAYSCSDPKEKEANKFAEDALIAPAIWRRMMNGANAKGLWFKNIMKELKALSDNNHLDFGIVSWRYRHDTRAYANRGLKATPIH